MTNLKKGITMKRVVSTITIWSLVMALNVTGVLWTFYKGVTSNFQWASNYTFSGAYGYGYGYDDTTWDYNTYGYGQDATYVDPNTGSNSGWSSSGWSSVKHMDVCNNGGDNSWDYYDWKCGNNTSSENSEENKNSENSEENKNSENSEEKNNQKTTDSTITESENAVTDSILGGKITIKDGIATMNGCNFPLKKHTFLDDNKTFATKYIALLQRLGIVHGRDGNGKFFVPESNTTRFEFIKMTERVFCLDYSNVDDSNLPFTDVTKGTWQGRVAQEALNAGLVTSKNTSFRGNDSISRIEAIKVLTLAAKMNVTATNSTVFTDVNINWMKKYAEAVRKAGIVNGQTVNGKLILEPLRNIKRSESAKIIVKTIWAK